MSAANAPNLHILKIHCLQLCLQLEQSGQLKMDKHSFERNYAVNLKQTFFYLLKEFAVCIIYLLNMEMYAMRQTAQIRYSKPSVSLILKQVSF